jgi:hypothetical protein
MVGYFVKAGDLAVDADFSPYSGAFGSLLDKCLAGRDYGDDLVLILIQYHLEGRYLNLPARAYRVMPYRKNERSLSVVVGVPRTFATKSEVEKRRFIVESTLEAIRLAREKMERLGYRDVRLGHLRRDVEACAQEFLSLSEDDIRSMWKG